MTQIELLNHKLALKDVLMDLKLPAAGCDRAKKNERIQRALAMIEEVKTTFPLSYACLARQVGLSYTTLMRWKRRLTAGKAAVGKRGPKKVQPLNLTELKQRIQGLDHGRKRSRGTGRLHGDYAGSISRRELDEMVRRVRSETNRQRAAETCRVSWLRPNLVWAVDDCQKSKTVGNGALHLHNLTHLCSRYRLPPIASGRLACGEEVAGHLAYLFDRRVVLSRIRRIVNRDHQRLFQHLTDRRVVQISAFTLVQAPHARTAMFLWW
ncbi:hypothetical protein ACFL0Q_01675 [Thermodesulfobacteriota bacterium]